MSTQRIKRKCLVIKPILTIACEITADVVRVMETAEMATFRKTVEI